MCNKAVYNDSHALEFVPDCCMTQEMRDKIVNTHFSAIEFIPECYKTQKMCVKAFNESSLAFLLYS